jgi:lipid-binding SYLF domain-containing protein
MHHTRQIISAAGVELRSVIRTKRRSWGTTWVALAIVLLGCAHPTMVSAPETGNKAEPAITKEARLALSNLKDSNSTAATLAETATGVLVFPSVTKAGLMVGGYRGDGVLLKGDEVSGYYKTTGASYGWQAGVQKYGYVLFFMSDRALRYADESQGWEVGVGPSVVFVDEGKAKTLTSTTVRDDVYAFVFDQRGLMAGMGLQGSKISRVQ